MKDSLAGYKDRDDMALSTSDSWLFILASLTVGGSEKKTVMIANELAAKGYDVHLAYLKKPEALLKLVSDNVKIVKLDRQTRVDIKAITKLRGYIKKNKITKVWNVNLYPMLYGFLATLFLGNKINRIVSVNTTYFPNYKEALQMILYIPIMYRMSKIVFGCEMQKKRWLRLYFLPKKKSSVIYNGVNTEYYNIEAFQQSLKSVRNKYGLSEDEFVIGVVAKLRPEKGHMSVIQAVKNLINKGCKVKLLLIGDGVEREFLEGFVLKKGLQKKVLFLGDVQDVREVVSILDVFVLPSVSVETFSNSALEAMSMSKPVILSNIGGASEMVESGCNGYLFAPNDFEELTVMLKKLFDVTLRDDMSHYSREKVSKEFSFNRMVESYIDV